MVISMPERYLPALKLREITAVDLPLKVTYML